MQTRTQNQMNSPLGMGINRTRKGVAAAVVAGIVIVGMSAMPMACRGPGQPADAWPAAPAEPDSVLEGTNIIPGQPEQRAPTAPPSPEPTPESGPEPAPEATPGPAPRPLPPAPDVPPREAPAAPEAGMQELFPNVRVDVAARVIEFDGIVPIDAHDPGAPNVYLEVTVCTPDTKEHESLVMARVQPSHVHAALLAINVAPGNPGGFNWDNNEMTTVLPRGDGVVVTFIYRAEDGKQHEVSPTQWIINAETGERFASGGDAREGGKDGSDRVELDAGRSGFVFAGSVMRVRGEREMYDADGIGTLVGLTTFGAETIAWREVISPDSHIHTPQWIADSENTPPFGTEVTVRIRPALDAR